MRSVITQIYEGDCCPGERLMAHIAGWQNAKNTAVQAHDAFKEKLCHTMKMEFDEYLSKESDVSSYHIQQAFTDGFRLGAQLMIEVLEVDKND